MTLNANAIPYFWGGGLQIFLYVIVNTVKVNVHLPKVCQYFISSIHTLFQTLKQDFKRFSVVNFCQNLFILI